MPDVLTKEQRSYNMSRIRGKNTKAELNLRRILREKGFRGYRIHYHLPGKPDIVFIRQKIAIFIDGCFWHKCPIHFTEPQSNKEFWMKKIDGNVKRDANVNEQLRKEGWTVLRFWEHEVKKEPEVVVLRILNYLLSCKEV
jgi:DNA mismatch endonuclease (patch repair protein)